MTTAGTPVTWLPPQPPPVTFDVTVTVAPASAPAWYGATDPSVTAAGPAQGDTP